MSRTVMALWVPRKDRVSDMDRYSGALQGGTTKIYEFEFQGEPGWLYYKSIKDRLKYDMAVWLRQNLQRYKSFGSRGAIISVNPVLIENELKPIEV